MGALEKFLEISGQKMAHWRRKNNMTQTQMAAKTKIPPRYIQKIEAGEANFTAATLLRITKILKIHPTQVLPTKAEWK